MPAEYSARDRITAATVQTTRLFDAAMALGIALQKFQDETGLLTKREKGELSDAMQAAADIRESMSIIHTGLQYSLARLKS